MQPSRPNISSFVRDWLRVGWFQSRVIPQAWTQWCPRELLNVVLAQNHQHFEENQQIAYFVPHLLRRRSKVTGTKQQDQSVKDPKGLRDELDVALVGERSWIEDNCIEGSFESCSWFDLNKLMGAKGVLSATKTEGYRRWVICRGRSRLWR